TAPCDRAFQYSLKVSAFERPLHLRHVRFVLGEDAQHLLPDWRRDFPAEEQRLLGALDAVVDVLGLVTPNRRGRLGHYGIRSEQGQRRGQAEPEAGLDANGLAGPNRIRR